MLGVGKPEAVVILRPVSEESVNPEPANTASEPPSSAQPGSVAPPDAAEAAQAEQQKLRDQMLRLAADFDNYKKRARKETQDAERRAREDFLRELLPVFDNLERAATHAVTVSDVKSLADGVGMVVRLFVDTLSRLGIERVTSVGQAFDPALHEAVQQLETTEFPPGAVAAEVQAGYRFGDRLVRPAMVVVAKPPVS